METQTQLEKIRKTSADVKTVCMIMLGLTIIFFCLVVSMAIFWHGRFTIGESHIDIKQMSFGGKTLFIFFVSLTAAIVIKGQIHLYRLFSNYSDGNVFTAGSVAQIRQLGVTLLLFAGLKILVVPWMVFLEHRMSLEGLPFLELFAGWVIILIARVMDAARGLREENEATI